jgi:hypothetical protein
VAQAIGKKAQKNGNLGLGKAKSFRTKKMAVFFRFTNKKPTLQPN